MVAGYHPKITRSTVQKADQKQSPVNYNMNQVKPVSMKRVVDARAKARQLRIVGQIIVPTAKIHLPIGLGINSSTLMLAAGTMRPNETMGQGNYALAGHHMINKAALFTPLYFKAHVGTQIYLTDMKNLYQYRVNVRKIISPYDVGVVNPTRQPLLTLITCNDSGSRRLLVRGKLVKKVPINRAPVKVRKIMKERTNNYNVLEGY